MFLGCPAFPHKINPQVAIKNRTKIYLGKLKRQCGSIENLKTSVLTA
jgi:hypothetical protein